MRRSRYNNERESKDNRLDKALSEERRLWKSKINPGIYNQDLQNNDFEQPKVEIYKNEDQISQKL